MPNPFAHIELATDDATSARKFYKAVFDWKFKDAPSTEPYTMIDVGAGTGGGITKKPDPKQPAAWLPYVEVADVKKTLAKAVKAGAKVVVGYQPIGEMGAIGVFIDPRGASLGIWQPGPAAPRSSAAKEPPARAANRKRSPAKQAAANKPSTARAKKATAPKKSAPAKKPAKKR